MEPQASHPQSSDRLLLGRVVLPKGLRTFSSPLRFAILALILVGFFPSTPAADLFVKVDNPGWTTNWGGVVYVGSKCWGDYDGDGFIDLFKAGSTGGPAPMTNQLYRNNGNGTFTRKPPRNPASSP